ncbi:IS110 family RNA-guided transposase [Capillimicrobium parvum]|uniref:IS110 family transposase n=1 Tax=Capillimicrobium parvum TaxID=2884022 RepID=UPI00216B5E31|nr:IS110 family transposase [Capillimicrobium parvum]
MKGDGADDRDRRGPTQEVAHAGSERALCWARRLGGERVWAIEDCRHVSGRLEEALIVTGERVVRVAPKLMAGARRGGRERGKSDPIDALAVARAALREGIETLPMAELEGQSLELRLLLDHREDIVAQRSDEQRRLRWHLHALQLGDDVPVGALDRKVWIDRVARRLARQPQDARVRIARELLRSIAVKTRQARQLEREIAVLVADQAPQLLDQPGCGPLTAAKLVGEIAGPGRFASDAKLARMAGVAPIPASSGRRDRHRLDRGGNRQLNCALHRWAVTAGRVDPATRDYLARKQAEGKTRMEALRSLKRHLARRAWRLLNQPTPTATPLDTALALT